MFHWGLIIDNKLADSSVWFFGSEFRISATLPNTEEYVWASLHLAVK